MLTTPPDANDESGSSELAAYAHGRFVDMFLGQSRRAQLGLLLAAALVATVWWRATHAPWAWLWFALMLAVAGWRFAYTERWVRAVRMAAQQDRRIVAVLLINGCMMAVPLLAFTQLSQLDRAALSIILLATATASVATTSGFRSVFVAYAAPMLLPLSFAWAAIGWPTHSSAELGLSALIFFFLLFLTSMGQQAAAVFDEATRFRFGEKDLNRQLAAALEEASEAVRAKARLLEAASHDLRQPSHTMNLLIGALIVRDLSAEAREAVSLLSKVNQSLCDQLGALLYMSKLDAGAIGVERAPLSLASLLADQHIASTPVAADRGIQFSLEVAPDAEHLHAETDETLLRRIIGNLTDNALKFTPVGGSVKLVLRAEAARALIQVSDTGIGIAPDQHTKVFREFYQVNDVEHDRMKGFGLGLSIVQRLCRLLGVEPDLESALGAGTTVSMRLPTCPAGAEREPDPAPTSSGSSLVAGVHVLVVDDDVLVRQSTALLLEGLGCIVRLADNVESAAAVAASAPVGLVLSDLRLRGGHSGLDAIAAVLRNRPQARGILITGDTSSTAAVAADTAGIRLLYKPVQSETLLAAMRATHPGMQA